MLLPGTFTVNHDLEEATFRRCLQRDRLLQNGCHPAVGVEQGRIPRGTARLIRRYERGDLGNFESAPSPSGHGENAR